ncbi:MAG: UpxY family transcription antiterminator [Planctomycetes bacterium]|nr:UpxY family transcription antiterminator [Planctomycetia bacterium]MBI3464504.1 UpxY family transcription antiterminator [Planctomycetota bacterium]
MERMYAPTLDHPSQFPTGLLAAAVSGSEACHVTCAGDALASAERTWLVLYTKSRQEKALARCLLALEIPFYLPLIAKTTICRGRRFRSRVPVFTNYLFLFASTDERVRALQTNRISRVLPVGDPERLEFDLRQLQRLIASDAPLTIESRLTPGRRVRIRIGVLAGLEGVVVRRQGKSRLIISVNYLQQGASVEIEDCQVEPID